MNTKIEELAEELGFEKDKYGLYWDQDGNSEGVDLEEFAKLIIEECCKIADDNYDFVVSAPHILKHFGLGEI